jgi:threonine dehydrogenase-like Zn-dependent dehydrogenase
VPDDFSDEAAVMIEPTACAAHAAARYEGHETVIIGAGTVGLLTLAAITARRDKDRSGPLIVTARYTEQRRLARELGADIVCTPDELPRWVRSATKSMLVGDQLTSGFRHVVDCVGSADSLKQALRVVAPGGDVQLVGMPGNVSLELTSLWHREVAIRGCYAYTRSDFMAAIEIVRRFDLARLVSATYPLAEYKDAIAHAASAGRRGAVKIAFDMRES